MIRLFYSAKSSFAYSQCAHGVGLAESHSDCFLGECTGSRPKEVAYNTAIPIEICDFMNAIDRQKAEINESAVSLTHAKLGVVLISIRFPPLADQQRTVFEVERRLSVIEELEATVAANLQRATRLRQSVLQLAFSGNDDSL